MLTVNLYVRTREILGPKMLQVIAIRVSGLVSSARGQKVIIWDFEYASISCLCLHLT